MLAELLAVANNNKIIWGLTMLLLNVGAKYVIADLGVIHEKFLANEIAKKIIIFSMFFVATRDIITAFVLSVLYVLIIDGIFHESRNFSIVKGTEDKSKNDDYESYLNNISRLRNTRHASQ